MKRFKFSLEPLLKTKGLLKREQEITLARLTMQKERLLEEKGILEIEILRIQSTCSQRLQKGLFAHEIAAYASYAKKIKDAQVVKAQEILKMEEKEHLAREELLKLRQESKMLESLKAKKYELYKEEEQAQILLETDERIAYDTSVQIQEVQ